MNDVTITIPGKVLEFIVGAFALGVGGMVAYCVLVFSAISLYWVWAQYANARDRKEYEKSLEKPDVHTRD